MWKSRSKTMRSPRAVIDGQRTRPLVNVVTCRGPGSRVPSPRSRVPRRRSRVPRRDRPDVLGAAAIGDEEDRTGAAPHRPEILRAAVRQGTPRRRRVGRGEVAQPDLRLVEMAVPVAPPLPRRVAARRHRQRSAVGRRRGEELVGVAIAADGRRRAAGGRDAVHVVHAAREIVRAREEVQVFPVARPAVELIRSVVVRHAPDVARRERQHVDVAAARARRHERQLRLVGRIDGMRLVRGVRDEEPRLAACGRHRPDVAARDERDLAAVSGDGRLRERGLRRNRR